MALSRRTGARFQANIWPGFVDAMTGLLLVLMFVLTIFMVVQFVLRETITGQESEMNQLNLEIAKLAQALGLEQRKATGLEARVGELDATLADAQAEVSEQAALIASLTTKTAEQARALQAADARITSFEAQVAGLLSERDTALATVSDLEAEQAELISRQEALNLALSQARSEIDAGTEAARRAAAEREALEALIAQAEAEAKAQDAALAQAQTVAQEQAAEITSLKTQLTDEEAARLVEVAAAEALRKRLEGASAELTAMTLALEAQRKEAEDTLTLLAAARAAQAEAEQGLLAAQAGLAEELSEAEKQAALLAAAKAQLAEEAEISATAQREQELLNQQVAALRGQLGSLQAIIDDYKERDAAANIQLSNLGQDLNAALARAAAEERKRRQLEEEERKRIEAERQDLERYRSEFFGRLRDVMGAQDGVKIVGDRFVFSSEVLFAQGQANLSRLGRGELSKIANILRNVANDIPSEIDWVIRVDGHTDNVPLSGFGEFADNWELSQARALSVVRYMVNFLGIPPERLSANGFGQYQPIAQGDSDEARAQNRRIELKFTEK